MPIDGVAAGAGSRRGAAWLASVLLAGSIGWWAGASAPEQVGSRCPPPPEARLGTVAPPGPATVATSLALREWPSRSDDRSAPAPPLDLNDPPDDPLALAAWKSSLHAPAATTSTPRPSTRDGLEEQVVALVPAITHQCREAGGPAGQGGRATVKVVGEVTQAGRISGWQVLEPQDEHPGLPECVRALLASAGPTAADRPPGVFAFRLDLE